MSRARHAAASSRLSETLGCAEDASAQHLVRLDQAVEIWRPGSRWIVFGLSKNCRLRTRALSAPQATYYPMAALITGSCLCSGIAFEIDGPLSQALNCHCSMCRKAQGAAFRSRARVLASNFRLTRGAELLVYFESSPGTHRGFCRVCGSPIHSRFDANPKFLGLPLGALDQDPGVRPEFHVFVGSKAPWYVIHDDLPQYDELPGPSSAPRRAT